MTRLCLLALVACTHAHPADSAYSATSSVKKAGDARAFHTVPLGPMTTDVEVLYGDPEKPGELYIIRINELPGTKIPLHTHPVDEHITVVQGTWYFTVGDTWDRSKLTPLHAGDYAFAPKGSTMFGECPDGAVVQLQGIGPFVIHWAHGVATLDDTPGKFHRRKGDHVVGPRGPGVIREGYASGDIVQYEIEAAAGRYMADEADVR